MQPPLGLLERERNPRKQNVFSFAIKCLFYLFYIIIYLFFTFKTDSNSESIGTFFRKLTRQQRDKSKLYANIHIELSEYRELLKQLKRKLSKIGVSYV